MDLQQNDWTIVFAYGRTLLGKCTSTSIDPVFDLQGGFVPVKTGELTEMHIAMPVLGLSSLTSLPLPSDALLVACSSLTAIEWAKLARALEVALRVQTQMRAANSGLVVTQQLPQLQRQ